MISLTITNISFNTKMFLLFYFQEKYDHENTSYYVPNLEPFSSEKPVNLLPIFLTLQNKYIQRNT